MIDISKKIVQIVPQINAQDIFDTIVETNADEIMHTKGAAPSDGGFALESTGEIFGGVDPDTNNIEPWFFITREEDPKSKDGAYFSEIFIQASEAKPGDKLPEWFIDKLN